MAKPTNGIYSETVPGPDACVDVTENSIVYNIHINIQRDLNVARIDKIETNQLKKFQN
jgi:hypothetical protein